MSATNGCHTDGGNDSGKSVIVIEHH